MINLNMILGDESEKIRYDDRDNDDKVAQIQEVLRYQQCQRDAQDCSVGEDGDIKDNDRVLDKNWTFLVQLAGDRPLFEKCMCLVNLSDGLDRNDVCVFKDPDGRLTITLGRESEDETDSRERRAVVGVWKYDEEKPFNERLTTFRIVSDLEFVRTFCDAATFDGADKKEIDEMKEIYGVL